MEKQPTVITENLSTGYITHKKKVVVSCNINERLYAGELNILMGRNGVGKSTILKTLAAFILPLEGKVEILGKDLSLYTPVELSKIIGVVLTTRLNLTHLTVKELVATGRSPYTGYWGRLSADDNNKIEESMALVGISSLSARTVATLSDGERQKTLIAKALAQETPLIFLHEPTAFLDYPSKVETLVLLKELARKHNKTIFLSTHDIEVAIQIADRLWLMDKTNGIMTGTPDYLSETGVIAEFFSTKELRYNAEDKSFRVMMPD